MKKIQKNQKAVNIFKKFLQDNDIINQAKNLFKNIEKEEFLNIIDALKKENVEIEDLFWGNPQKLRTIANIINQFRSDFDSIYDNVKPYLNAKDENKVPSNIRLYYNIIKFFKNSYNTFSDKRKEYAFEFTKALGIMACPYCNLEYTETVIYNDKKIYRPDFDHFYPKKLYPFLSIAFYNLIPSCCKCNEILKKQQDTKDFLTPYEYDFHNMAKFKVIFKKNKEIPLNEIRRIDQFELKLIEKDTCAINNDIQRAILEIEPRYNYRKDEITDITSRYRTLTQNQLAEPARMFRGIYTDEEMIKIILGDKLEPKYINSKPLTKLKIDLREMLIKNY